MTGIFETTTPGHDDLGRDFPKPAASAADTLLLDMLIALAISAAVFAIAHWKALVSPFVINDDLRQQIFWMQRWLDPALYPADILNTYAEAYVPWGVKLLYWCGSWIMNPLQFSKAITGFLFCGQCLLMMSLGRRLGDRQTGWAMLCAAWLMPFFLDNISGGLSRSFASPLLAAYALAWMSGKGAWLGLTLTAQALFIPYIFLPCSLALLIQKGFAALRAMPGIWLNTWRQWTVLGAAGLAVGSFSLVYAMKGFGPLVSLAQATGRPEFGPQGRLDLVPLPNPFLDFVYFPFEGIGLFKELGLLPGIVSLCLLAWPLQKGARLIDWQDLARRIRPLVPLGAAFLVFYIAARAMAFTLFVPDRYAQYPLNLLYAMLLSSCLLAAWKGMGKNNSTAMLLLAALAVCGAVRLTGVALYDLRANQALYAAVEASTPKDAMLAGHPDLMDNVLTFSKRNVLASTELAQPWSVGYWEKIRPRLEGLFAAYYSEDPEEILRFAERFNVDFLVVVEAHFTQGYLSHTPFFEPFAQIIKDMTRGRARFAVLDDTSFPHIPLRPGAFLLDLRALRQARPSQG